MINLKKPILGDEKPTEDGVAYTVTGPTENVFASLVVLLGYTHTFTRTNQWQNNARYEVGEGLVCGFRQEAERDGELDFVLSFCSKVGQPVRMLFQGVFESLLARRNLSVTRYEPVRCTNPDCGHLLDRSVVRERMKEGKTFAFCNDCGKKLKLPKMDAPIQLTREAQVEVDEQRRAAEQRTRFEQAIYRVQAYVGEQKIKVPECFISYAWGVPEHERWVEKRLATDLQKAGIVVVLDRWHNAQIGASVARFIERIEKTDRIIMVGTPLYRRKYENKDTSTGYVVAAEVDLIASRLLGTEAQKESVLPILLEGEGTTSFPRLLRDRVYADFRKEEDYFLASFDLILSLYGIAPSDPGVADLGESLRVVSLELSRGRRDDLQILQSLQKRVREGGGDTERQAAVQQLAREWATDPGTLPILRGLVSDDKSSAVRRAAVQELARGWREDPETLNIVRECAQHDPSRDVRQAAVQELARGGREDSNTLQILEACGRNDKDELVRLSALQEVASVWRYHTETLRLLDHAASNDVSNQVCDFATSERKNIRNQRVSQWLDWLNGKTQEEAFEHLPEVEEGFPVLRVLALRLRDIGPFKDTGRIWLRKTNSDRARQITLILGDNASGKSTLLRCIALAFLGPDLALLADESAERYLRYGSERGTIEVLFQLHLDEGTGQDAESTFCVGIEIRAGQRKFQATEASVLSFGRPNAADRLSWLRQHKYDRFGFMCAYGALRNLTKQKDSQSEIPGGLIARVSSLFRSSASLIDPDFLNRLLRGEPLRLTGSREMSLEPEVRKRIIKWLEDLLPAMHEAASPQISSIALHGVPVPLPELSEGYASLLALAGHLLYHALHARDWKGNPTDANGLVLIDEIDLHLHPAWQRSVLTDLQRLLPNIQIVATSHSPFVAGSVEADSTIVLRRDGEEIRVVTDLPSTEGWRADQIVTSDLFGLPTSRNILTEKLHKEYAELLSQRGPEDPQVQERGRLLATLLGNQGEGKIDKETNKLLDDFLRERFSQLNPEEKKLVLASAGLKLAD